MSEKSNAELFRLVGGHPALDLINTTAPRAPSADHIDALTSPEELLIWARRADVAAAADLREIAGVWDATPSTGVQALHAVVDIRETTYAVLATRLAVADAPQPGPALERLTLRWSAATARCQLTLDEDELPARLIVGTAPATMIPDRLAHAAMDLLRTAELRRLRVCPPAEGGCGWLFLDRSRNGSRRWCAMEDCGTNAKVRRLTDRRRSNRATINS
jgi:predicted RNA-binding Zn ribbon-like protein